jgi:two-component system, NtrC family, sensor kinase
MVYNEVISCRVIKACLDYAFTNNVSVEDLIAKYNYSHELLEDTYNWVSLDFFNDLICIIETNTKKQNLSFEIASSAAAKTSWGDIENVIKIIGDPKPILKHIERFSSYFFKLSVLTVVEKKENSITIKLVGEDEKLYNLNEFLIGTIISIPKLWGGESLSAIRLEGFQVKISVEENPSFFEASKKTYKDFSPSLLEDVILSLEKTKNTIENKNKLLEKKNIALANAYKKLEQNIEDKVQNEKISMIGRLATGIAHEINNPLSFIISNIETLETYFKDVVSKNEIPKDIKEDIPLLMNETKQGLDRVKKLVEDINFIAHPGSKEKIFVDIADIISGAIRLTKNLHKNKIEIQEDYKHKDKTLCDPSKISQVILNILINAIQAIQEKKINTGKIKIKTKQENGYINIIIEDNGIGIEKDKLPYIEEPFFTTKPAGVGTGLGLSTVKSIINTHKGNINFQSKKDEKTKVNIILPININILEKNSLF